MFRKITFFVVIPVPEVVIFYTLHMPSYNDLSKIDGFSLTKPLGPVLFNEYLKTVEGYGTTK